MRFLVVGAFLALSPLVARAGNNTYCVGGFGQWTKPCNAPQVRSQHRAWHFHTHLTDGKSCYECYDEEDDSCDTDFLKKNAWKGWKKADQFQCNRLPPAPDNVYELVNRGLPQVDPNAEAAKKQAEMEKILEEARREAERLKQEQLRKEEAQRQAEAERKRLEDLEAQRRGEEERRRQEEAARIRAEADAAKRAELERLAEGERRRQEAELERLRKEREAAAEAERLARDEAARKGAEALAKAEEEARRRAEEEAERKRRASENAPIPLQLKTEIVRMSPGPFAAGDTVSVVARIAAQGGSRPAGGGDLVITKADGTKETVRGKAEADGTVSFSFVLPPGGNASIAVTGTSPRLQHREKPDGPIASATQTLTVSPCRLRTKLTSPQANMPSTPGPTKVRGEVVDAQGKPVNAAALGGAKLVFTVDAASGAKQKADATFGADGLVEAMVELPKPTGDDKLSFALVAEGRAGDICPGPLVETTLSELGVAIDLSLLPKKCYVDRPCPIDVTLRLPDDPATRPAAEQYANAPNLVATVKLGGTPFQMRAGAAGSYKVDAVPGVPGELETEVTFDVDGRLVVAKGIVPVRWPLHLAGPTELDLGTVGAGTSWQDTCKPLDLAASTGVEEQDLKVEAIVPEGCQATLVGNFGGLRGKYSDGITLEMDASRQIPVCIETSACASGETQSVKLVVSAVNPDFADQKFEIPVKYVIQGRGWLACNMWWIAALAGVLLLGALGYGFIVPLDFSNDDLLRVAAKEAALPRAVARRLREMPGGKKGWYRNATFGLRNDGSATDDVKTALVVFRAGRSEILLSARGTLSRMNPRTHKMEPVSDPQSHSLSKNAVYEVGGLYFKVS